MEQRVFDASFYVVARVEASLLCNVCVYEVPQGDLREERTLPEWNDQRTRRQHLSWRVRLLDMKRQLAIGTSRTVSEVERGARWG
jgi:hypothetical protein